MKLLLDTHFLIWLVDGDDQIGARETALLDDAEQLLVSVVSLWELRIKRRTERRRGGPARTLSPETAIAFCEAAKLTLAALEPTDVTARLAADPDTADPFDEMLLVHAHRLGARLLTRDEKLLGHPLAIGA